MWSHWNNDVEISTLSLLHTPLLSAAGLSARERRVLFNSRLLLLVWGVQNQQLQSHFTLSPCPLVTGQCDDCYPGLRGTQFRDREYT